MLYDRWNGNKETNDFHKINSKYAEFIDYGNLPVENREEYASESLAFMLTGLRTYCKCPVGYFLTNNCYSEIQTSLLKNFLSLAADHGLRAWSVTWMKHQQS